MSWTPEDTGLLPYGGKEELVTESVSLSGLTVSQVFKTPVFWLVIFAVMVINIFIMALPTYAPVIWMDAGMDVVKVGTLLTVATILCAVSTFFSGIIADKAGNKIYVIYLHVAFVLSCLFTVLSVGSLNMFYIYMSLLFLIIGVPIFTTMIPTITFELFGARDYEKISGILQAAIQIGLMLMPIIAGILISNYGSYKSLFVAGGISGVLSIVVFLYSLIAAPAKDMEKGQVDPLYEQ